MRILLGRAAQVADFFLSSLWVCHATPSGFQIFCRKVSRVPYEHHLYMTIYFSFVAFRILSNLCHFNHVMSWCGFVWVHLFGTLCASCTWISVSFFRVGKFLAVISSDIFLIPFSLFYPSGTANVVMLNVIGARPVVLWLLSEFRVASNTLLESALKMAAVVPPRLTLGALGLLPGHGLVLPRSSAQLWHGVSRAGACAHPTLGCVVS